MANNRLDLITLRESVVGSKYAVSVLGALKPWIPDLLIAVSSSANVLCIDGSLDGVKSKQGFDDLAVDGNIEDYLGSKQKDLKNFKENLLVFLDSLILECQDGPLFDQVFMEKFLFHVLLQEFFDRLRHWLDSSL